MSGADIILVWRHIGVDTGNGSMQFLFFSGMGSTTAYVI